MKVLVLGGYGLIGLSIARRLQADGHTVVGLGRSKAKGEALLPSAEWIEADLATLKDPLHWRSHLAGIDVIVNASGVLQNGIRDDVVATQQEAIIALISACEDLYVKTFIQISAPDARIDSNTEFFRTKAIADAALKGSKLAWTIFRPGLVISPQAYGGTSLLRSLAGFPLVQPVVLGEARVQTVAVDDVPYAVSMSIAGKYQGKDFDLVEPDTHSLEDLILIIRRWLAFPRPLAVIRLPAALGYIFAYFADVAGYLGWRSAIRTTALKSLVNGVIGDGSAWTTASGAHLKTLDETLNALPSTMQERVYSRIQFVFPLLVLVLSGFWLASGAIGIIRLDTAEQLLAGHLSPVTARLAVIGGSAADVLIGLGMLLRPYLRLSCFAAVVISIAYLIGSIIYVPTLWMDPIGPMVKVFPAMALALAVAAMAEER